MNIRPYVPGDFDAVSEWITDERTHAMWSANRFRFPLQREDFEQTLEQHAEASGDRPFVAVSDDGAVIGFFCYSLNQENKEGMLKFIVVDGCLRGQGIGQEMLRHAVRQAFETGAEAVQLMVFSVNARARHCYEKAGFTERRTDADAFRFGAESWDRSNLVIRKTDTGKV